MKMKYEDADSAVNASGNNNQPGEAEPIEALCFGEFGIC